MKTLKRFTIGDWLLLFGGKRVNLNFNMKTAMQNYLNIYM
jgi:hypothetical protein